MKKLILAGFFAVITLNVPDDEVKIVENDVISAEAWIKEAWEGKVSKCSERVIQSEVQVSLAEGTAIPSSKADIIKKHFKRAGYKNRAAREAEAAKLSK